MTRGEIAALADRIVLDVCELPDRTSPEDAPEMMLVSGEELFNIVLNNLNSEALAALREGAGVVEGYAVLERVKTRLEIRLNDYLCEMKPGFDDSMTGFNEAWDIMRAIFSEELAGRKSASPPPQEAPAVSGRPDPTPEMLTLVEIAARAIFDWWREDRGIETTWDELKRLATLPNADSPSYRACVGEARAVLSAVEGWLRTYPPPQEASAASVWRDIASAPKDFTPVLSWDGVQCAVVAYDGRCRSWVLLEGENEAHGDCPIGWEVVTHWQPLPAPPEQPKPQEAPAASCLDCGLAYSDPGFDDFVVSDETWRQLCPEDDGLLCVTCMIRRAAAKGIEAEGAFTSGPFADHDWRKERP